jgi:chemotaxis signal transduction protein
VVASDLGVLEDRARALAADAAADDAAGSGQRLVAFRLGGRPCAVSAGAVERAVSRLPPGLDVPSSDGAERPVTWVDERPVLVADLAGALSGAPRRAAALAGSPAVVVTTPDGAVAVAVEGPLELREEDLRAVSSPGDDAGQGLRPRVSGALADGTSVLDPMWLVGWAARAAQP